MAEFDIVTKSIVTYNSAGTTWWLYRGQTVLIITIPLQSTSFSSSRFAWSASDATFKRFTSFYSSAEDSPSPNDEKPLRFSSPTAYVDPSANLNDNILSFFVPFFHNLPVVLSFVLSMIKRNSRLSICFFMFQSVSSSSMGSGTLLKESLPRSRGGPAGASRVLAARGCVVSKS